LTATATRIALALLLSIVALCLLGCLLLKRQRRLAADQLDLYSQHDQLTGLPNHSSFQKHIDHTIAEGRESNETGSVILCEIAGLDVLSQNYGLQAADNVAVLTANRLAELKPANCHIGSIAFGRFGLFVPKIGDAMEVLVLAKVLTQKLSQSANWQNEAIPLSVHVGIALSPADAPDAAGLIRCAELALRQAQEQGSLGYSFFNPAIAQDARRRVAVQRAVTDALAQNTFRLDFQPVYGIQSGELLGFEALLRLHDAELGAVSPAEFVPIAEQAGLINRIGAWCLAEACRVAAQWPPHLVVAVNLSPAQFYSGSIINDVRNALDRSRLPAYRLEVEITEGTLLKESELVLQQLGVLRDMGISVALDDFGTGYSSLSYLWKFPFSKIKIDRSFVSALGQSQNARGILRTIIKLGHGLGLSVTAEGIETAAQFASLKELHCDLAQGYLLGRPSRVADLAAIILRNFADGISRKAAHTQVPAEIVETVKLA
jgi:diguanylate cyclase (GGDEF)-like protein